MDFSPAWFSVGFITGLLSFAIMLSAAHWTMNRQKRLS